MTDGALPGLRDRLTLVLPAGTSPDVIALVRAELGEVGTALGVPVELGATATGPTWVCEAGDGPTRLSWDPASATLRTRGQVAEGWQLLHPLVAQGGGTVAFEPPTSRADLVDRVAREVAASYPGFELRGLDWTEICDRHAPDVLAADDPRLALEQWFAELGDVHTAVRSTAARSNPPYAARAQPDAVVLARVPPGSAAHRHGVRPGWRLDGLDPRGWLARTGAPPHVHALLAGRRAIEINGAHREFAATAPDGRRVRWTETAEQLTPATAVSARVLDAGTAYLRITAFVPGLLDEVDPLLHDLRAHPRLVLDLRGCTGGQLVAATRLRDRFLRGPTALGAIRYSDGRGRLGPALPLTGEPAPSGRWPGELAVLTDGLTASAAEDFLLGLQGLPHVRVIGEPSAGGSGRPRTVPLRDDLVATISTALTEDRAGRVVEGAGIPVDLPVPAFDDEAVLRTALTA